MTLLRAALACAGVALLLVQCVSSQEIRACAGSVAFTNAHNNKHYLVTNCSSRTSLSFSSVNHAIVTVNASVLGHITIGTSTNLTLRILQCTHNASVFGQPFISMNASVTSLKLFVLNSTIETKHASVIYSGPAANANNWCTSCSLLLMSNTIDTAFATVIYIAKLLGSNLTVSNSSIVNTLPKFGTTPRTFASVEIVAATSATTVLFSKNAHTVVAVCDVLKCVGNAHIFQLTTWAAGGTIVVRESALSIFAKAILVVAGNIGDIDATLSINLLSSTMTNGVARVEDCVMVVDSLYDESSLPSNGEVVGELTINATALSSSSRVSASSNVTFIGTTCVFRKEGSHSDLYYSAFIGSSIFEGKARLLVVANRVTFLQPRFSYSSEPTKRSSQFFEGTFSDGTTLTIKDNMVDYQWNQRGDLRFVKGSIARGCNASIVNNTMLVEQANTANTIKFFSTFLASVQLRFVYNFFGSVAQRDKNLATACGASEGSAGVFVCGNSLMPVRSQFLYSRPKEPIDVCWRALGDITLPTSTVIERNFVHLNNEGVVDFCWVQNVMFTGNATMRHNHAVFVRGTLLFSFLGLVVNRSVALEVSGNAFNFFGPAAGNEILTGWCSTGSNICNNTCVATQLNPRVQFFNDTTIGSLTTSTSALVVTQNAFNFADMDWCSYSMFAGGDLNGVVRIHNNSVFLTRITYAVMSLVLSTEARSGRLSIRDHHVVELAATYTSTVFPASCARQGNESALLCNNTFFVDDVEIFNFTVAAGLSGTNKSSEVRITNNTVDLASASLILFTYVSQVFKPFSGMVLIAANVVRAKNLVGGLYHTTLQDGVMHGRLQFLGNEVDVTSESAYPLEVMVLSRVTVNEPLLVRNNFLTATNAAFTFTALRLVRFNVDAEVCHNLVAVLPEWNASVHAGVDLDRSRVACPSSAAFCNNSYVVTGAVPAVNITLLRNVVVVGTNSKTLVFSFHNHMVYVAEVPEVAVFCISVDTDIAHFRGVNNSVLVRGATEFSMFQYSQILRTGVVLVAGNSVYATNDSLLAIQSDGGTCRGLSTAQSVVCNNTVVADRLASTLKCDFAFGLEVHLSTTMHVRDNVFETANVTAVVLRALNSVTLFTGRLNMSGNAVALSGASKVTLSLLTNFRSNAATTVNVTNNEVVSSTATRNVSTEGFACQAQVRRTLCDAPAAIWQSTAYAMMCRNLVSLTIAEQSSSTGSDVSVVVVGDVVSESNAFNGVVRFNTLRVLSPALATSVFLANTFTCTHSSQPNANVTVSDNFMVVESVSVALKSSLVAYVCRSCGAGTLLATNNCVKADAHAGTLVTALVEPSNVAILKISVLWNSFLVGHTSPNFDEGTVTVLGQFSGNAALSVLVAHTNITCLANVTKSRVAVFLARAIRGGGNSSFNWSHNNVTVAAYVGSVSLAAGIEGGSQGSGAAVLERNRVTCDCWLSAAVRLLSDSELRSNAILVVSNVVTIRGRPTPLLTETGAPLLSPESNATIVVFDGCKFLWNATGNTFTTQDVDRYIFTAAQGIRTPSSTDMARFLKNNVTATGVRHAATSILQHGGSNLQWVISDNTFLTEAREEYGQWYNLSAFFTTTQSSHTTKECTLTNNTFAASGFSSLDTVMLRFTRLLVGERMLISQNVFNATMQGAVYLRFVLFETSLFLPSSVDSSALNCSDNVVLVTNTSAEATTLIALVSSSMQLGFRSNVTAARNTLRVHGGDRLGAGSTVNISGFRFGSWLGGSSVSITDTVLQYVGGAAMVEVAVCVFVLPGSSTESLVVVSNNVSVSGNISHVRLIGVDASNINVSFVKFNDNFFAVPRRVDSVSVSLLLLGLSAGVSATANTLVAESLSMNGTFFQTTSGLICAFENGETGAHYTPGSSAAKTALVNSSACRVAFARNWLRGPFEEPQSSSSCSSFLTFLRVVDAMGRSVVNMTNNSMSTAGVLASVFARDSNVSVVDCMCPMMSLDVQTTTGGLNTSVRSSNISRVTLAGVAGVEASSASTATLTGSSLAGIALGSGVARLQLNVSSVRVTSELLCDAAEPDAAFLSLGSGPYANISADVAAIHFTGDARLLSMRNVSSLQHSRFVFSHVLGGMSAPVFAVPGVRLAEVELRLQHSMLAAPHGLLAASDSEMHNTTIVMENSTLSEINRSFVLLPSSCVNCNLTVAGSTVAGVNTTNSTFVTLSGTQPPVGTLINVDNSTVRDFNESLRYGLAAARRQSVTFQMSCIVWYAENVSDSRRPVVGYGYVPLHFAVPHERSYFTLFRSAYSPTLKSCEYFRYVVPTRTPSPSSTRSVSASSTKSKSPTISLSRSRSASISPSMVVTPTWFKFVTPTPPATPTASLSVSASPSASQSPSVSHSLTRSLTLSPSLTPSSSRTVTPPPTLTPTHAATASLSISMTVSPSVSVSASASFSPSVSNTISPSVTQTPTPSVSSSVSLSSSPTTTYTQTGSLSQSFSLSTTPPPTHSKSHVPSLTSSATPSVTTTSSRSPTLSTSPTFSPTQPPPMMLTTAVTLRINGTKWDDVLAAGNESIIQAVTTFTAAATNVTEPFVKVTRLAVGSLIADVEISYRADSAPGEAVVVTAILANANLTELAVLYNNITGLGEAVSFFGVRLTNSSLVLHKPATCDRQCRIGLGVGLPFVFALVVVLSLGILQFRRRSKLHVNENSPVAV